MMNIAILVATAWAAAASCPTDGECEVSHAASHSMLQTSKASSRDKELLRTKGMSKGTQQLYMQVEALVADLVASKRNASSGEVMAIELMNLTLTNTTLPAVFKGHQDDQFLMDNAVAALDNCESNLQNDSATAAGLKVDMESKGTMHKSCRSTESTLEDTKTEKATALSTFHSDLNIPSVPSDVSSLDGYFSQIIQWATDKNSSYASKSKDLDTATTTYEGKHAECNVQQGEYESGYCQWHIRASSAMSSHETCWSQSNASFTLIRSTVLDSAAQRKSEFTAVKLIQCLLKAISGDVMSIQQQLDQCTDMVVETDFLSIGNLNPPNKSEPDFGNLSLQPGELEWTDSEYSSLPSNAGAVAVTACSGVSV